MSVAYFSRGTLPTEKRVRKGTTGGARKCRLMLLHLKLIRSASPIETRPTKQLDESRSNCSANGEAYQCARDSFDLRTAIPASPHKKQVTCAELTQRDISIKWGAPHKLWGNIRKLGSLLGQYCGWTKSISQHCSKTLK